MIKTIERVFDQMRDYFPELKGVVLFADKQSISFSNEKIELSFDETGKITGAKSARITD